MATISEFRQRLETEFGRMSTAIQDQRPVLERQYHERQERLAETYAPALAQLRGIWEPRRDAFLAQFQDAVHTLAAGQGDLGTVAFSVDSPLAQISLRFTFSLDPDVRNIILEYHLEIIPRLMKSDNHSILELQLGNFDQEVAARWLEDRMVSFIRIFVALNESQYYVHEHWWKTSCRSTFK